ncbi:uncharacterized protein PV09_07305 [Verruconis gallopava]|uniref:Protein ZIP4 homolog n=1 Tax=Verruconis gallopava TaxID=253628 RepID=A0A0D1XGD7_9PEZI|nr:uncharacterized protein PV09_07305 [Verruconis gallopava]KIW01266.1 hypothetical protein PV09_07305 [Verruconis gallopava]
MPHAPIQSVLNFANEIEIGSPSLTPDLRTRISCLPAENIQPKQRAAFETRGTELWNIATRHSRELGVRNDASDQEGTKNTLLRVFAFGMLDTAARSRNNQSKRLESCTRILKVAFKTMKACLRSGELDLASKVAQSAAFWVSESEGLMPEDLKLKMEAEYYIWRVALVGVTSRPSTGTFTHADVQAWQQDKLDVAEHMYGKFGKDVRCHPDSAEDLADTLYELGKSLFVKSHYELAATWLERAFNAIDSVDLGQLSDDSGELRLAILQLLVRSLLMIKTTAAIDKARHFVGLVELNYSDKLVAALLKLEMLSAETSPNAADYFDMVNRVIRTTMLTRANFKTIMHHIHKLKKLSATLASRALDNLIHSRLFDDAKDDWIERACMMRIWIATTVEDGLPNFSALKELFDKIHHTRLRSFSSTAAYAAQTLMWSNIERAYNEKEYDLVERFCELALHELFSKCGELNRAKVARKWILSTIKKGDSNVARKVYFQLPETARNAPETRYLMHRVALRENDPAFAAECLNIVAMHADKDSTRLYACVLDAVELGDGQQAYLALKKALEAYEKGVTNGVHLPALLRCMIRTIEPSTRSSADNGHEIEQAIESICSVFETAVQYAKKPVSNNAFTVAELTWFSKNCYNVAVDHMTQIHPSLLLRLCLACDQLIERLTPDAPSAVKKDLRLRHIFCKYLIVTTFIILARGEDCIEHSLNHYNDTLKHAAVLRRIICEHMEDDTLSDSIKTNLVAKHVQTIKYELEATLRLKKWDDLSKLFEQCWKYEDPKQWSTLADISFSIHAELCEQGPELMLAHQNDVLMFIERIVAKSWKPHEPIEKLAKYLRCFFQLTLGKEDSLAVHCIDQVTSIANKCKIGKNPYPLAELEWMAITAFNHSVTCYCIKDDVSCQLWAEKAMMLASHADDGGALSDELQKKYAQMRWED